MDKTEKLNQTRQRFSKPRRCSRLAALVARKMSVRLAAACRR